MNDKAKRYKVSIPPSFESKVFTKEEILSFNDLFLDTTIQYKDKKQAKRYNNGKLQWTQIDFNSLEELVKVLEYGAKKYGKHNWKKGLPITEIAESLLRHLFLFLDGEDKDNESGVSHIGHILANAMFMNYMHKNKSEFDDREIRQC